MSGGPAYFVNMSNHDEEFHARLLMLPSAGAVALMAWVRWLAVTQLCCISDVYSSPLVQWYSPFYCHRNSWTANIKAAKHSATHNR